MSVIIRNDKKSLLLIWFSLFWCQSVSFEILFKFFFFFHGIWSLWNMQYRITSVRSRNRSPNRSLWPVFTPLLPRFMLLVLFVYFWIPLYWVTRYLFVVFFFLAYFWLWNSLIPCGQKTSKPSTRKIHF